MPTLEEARRADGVVQKIAGRKDEEVKAEEKEERFEEMLKELEDRESEGKTVEAVEVVAVERDSNGEEKEVPVEVEVLPKNDTNSTDSSLIVTLGEGNSTKEEKKDEYVIDISNVDVEQLAENVEPNEEVVIDVSDVKNDTTEIPVEIREKEEQNEDVKEQVILDLKDILESDQPKKEEPETPQNRPLDLKFYDYLKGKQQQQPQRPVSTIFTLFFTPEIITPKLMYPTEIQPTFNQFPSTNHIYRTNINQRDFNQPIVCDRCLRPVCTCENQPSYQQEWKESPRCSCQPDFNQICNQCRGSPFSGISSVCQRCNMPQCTCQPDFNQLLDTRSTAPFNQISSFCQRCNAPKCTCQPFSSAQPTIPFDQLSTNFCQRCNMPTCTCQPDFNQLTNIFNTQSTNRVSDICQRCNSPRCTCQPFINTQSTVPFNQICPNCNTQKCTCQPSTFDRPSADICQRCNANKCTCQPAPFNPCDICRTSPCVCFSRVTSPAFGDDVSDLFESPTMMMMTRRRRRFASRPFGLPVAY